MELIFKGQYSDVYKKYSHELITYFCKGVKPGVMSEELKRDYGVDISFQAINYFYKLNKEYIDNCIQKSNSEELDKLKEVIAIEFCTDKLKEFLFLLSKDLPTIVKSLEHKDQAKLIVSVCNSIAKFEGMEKPEVNITNSSTHETDDAVLGELLDVIRKTVD